MLDQNTDRMWYVIGAVIVGAALIFLMNNSFPQLFASIGETFEDKAEQAMDVTAGIMPNVRHMNLLSHGSVQMEGGHIMLSDGSIADNVKGHQMEYLRHEDLAPIIDTYGLDRTYTLRFDIKSKDVSKANEIKVYMQNGNTSKYRFDLGPGYMDKWMTVTEEFQQVTIYGVRFKHDPNDTYYDDTYAHLAFYGGTRGVTQYGNGNIPVVQNIELFFED